MGETPEVVSAPVLAERLRLTEKDDRKTLIAKATKLGLLHPLGEGQFEVPSPALLAAAEEVVARGVELDHALAMLDSVIRHSRAVSKEFVRLFTDDVLKPYAEAERWDELEESIQASRPLAAPGAAGGLPSDHGRGGRGDVRATSRAGWPRSADAT